MRMLSAVVAATALMAGAANAQMKLPAQPPASNPATSPVVISTDTPLESAKRMNRDEAIKMVKSGKAVWVDVRPVDQYNQGHITGAMNIPLSDLPARMNELPKNKYLITYCA